MSQAPSRPALWTRLRNRLFHLYFRLSRPMTLGARGVIYRTTDDAVFLVRHTYVPGWQLPGGGLEVGETMEDALTRELAEEAGVELTAPPVLMSIHFNRRASRRDHVALFLITDFVQAAPKQPDREIAEAGFFPLAALPDGTTPATRARLDELFAGKPVSPYW